MNTNSTITSKIKEIQSTQKPSPEVAEATAEHEAEKAKKELLPGIIPIWHGDLREMDIKLPSWAVDQLISKGSINVISGLPESHKSFICGEIVRCMSLGVPFLGKFATERCKALIIDEENHLGRSKLRLDLLSDEALDVAILAEENIEIDKSGVAEAIVRFCKDNDVGTVVFDSLSSFHSADENSNPHMAAVMKRFMLIAKAGITVIIITHLAKNTKRDPTNATPRGAGEIWGKCDVHISLRHDGDDVDTVIIKQHKNRDALKLPEFKVAVHREEDRTWFECVGEVPKQVGAAQRTDEAIIELLTADGELYQGQVFNALSVISGIGGQKMIVERLEALKSSGVLNHHVGKHNRNYYSIKAGTNS